jgi:hypothetical protein
MQGDGGHLGRHGDHHVHGPGPGAQVDACAIGRLQVDTRRAKGSDCQRGTQTPGPTLMSIPQNWAVPEVQASGTPTVRRATQ